MKKESSEYYVYVHIRPDTNTVFYVGKGKNGRAFQPWNRNDHWKNIVAKNEGEFMVKIVYANLTDQEAAKKEKEVIASYGRKNLCNQTDGGEGACGWIPSEETKKKIAAKHKGKVVSESTRKKLAEINSGKVYGPRPLPVKQKISLANSGENNGMYGKTLPIESRRKQAEKLRGANNYLAKPIINLLTGIFYDTLQEAADSCSMKKGTLWAMIVGKRKNKTSFIYA